MKCVIYAGALKEMCSPCANALANREFNTARQGLLLTADGDTLTIVASNETTRAEIECYCYAVKEAGTALIADAKRFIASVRELDSNGTVEIETTKSECIVKAGRTEMRFPTLDAATYPVFPTDGATTFTVGADTFRTCIESVIKAAAANDMRPALTGIALQGGGGTLDIVALDGFQMYHAAMDCDAECDIIIPAAAFKAVFSAANGETLEITIGKTVCEFCYGGAKIAVRMLSATYPDWRTIFDRTQKAHTSMCAFDSDAMMRALKRMAACTDADVARFDIGQDELIIYGGTDASDFSETINAEMVGSEAALNYRPRQIVNALDSVGGQSVMVCYGAELTPIIIKRTAEDADDLDRWALVMPMRAR